MWNVYLEGTLHLLSQNLLIPVMIILVFLVIFTLYSIGSIVVEGLTERRCLQAKIPELLDMLDAARIDEFDTIIERSGLLRRQKSALQELTKHPQLPEDTLVALAKRLLATEDLYYQKIVARTDLMSKVAPMFGLMGTLIPLGPGLVALGQGDVSALAASLLTAFDCTVSGLISAAVVLSISKLRRRWYEDYMISIESVMTGMLKKIVDAPSDEKIKLRVHAQNQDRLRARTDVQRQGSIAAAEGVKE